MARAWGAITAHRATVGFVILAFFVMLALLGVQARATDACRDRTNSYDALHAIIVKSYAPQPPPAAVLNLFPQIRPIYTPGTPQYRAAQEQTGRRRAEVLALLGDRPSC